MCSFFIVSFDMPNFEKTFNSIFWPVLAFLIMFYSHGFLKGIEVGEDKRSKALLWHFPALFENEFQLECVHIWQLFLWEKKMDQVSLENQLELLAGEMGKVFLEEQLVLSPPKVSSSRKITCYLLKDRNQHPCLEYSGFKWKNSSGILEDWSSSLVYIIFVVSWKFHKMPELWKKKFL